MQKPTFEDRVERIVARDPRYHGEAYAFVCEALEHTQKRAASRQLEIERHVTPQQLVEGIREFALDQYGPMAIVLLHEWGVRQCADFGEIVFNLIDEEVLRKTDTDRREDFAGHFEFEQAFRHPFLPASHPDRRNAVSAAPAGE